MAEFEPFFDEAEPTTPLDDPKHPDHLRASYQAVGATFPSAPPLPAELENKTADALYEAVDVDFDAIEAGEAKLARLDRHYRHRPQDPRYIAHRLTILTRMNEIEARSQRVAQEASHRAAAERAAQNPLPWAKWLPAREDGSAYPEADLRYADAQARQAGMEPNDLASLYHAINAARYAPINASVEEAGQALVRRGYTPEQAAQVARDAASAAERLAPTGSRAAGWRRDLQIANNVTVLEQLANMWRHRRFS